MPGYAQQGKDEGRCALICHREAALAAVAIQSRISDLTPGLLRFARNDGDSAFSENALGLLP